MVCADEWVCVLGGSENWRGEISFKTKEEAVFHGGAEAKMFNLGFGSERTVRIFGEEPSEDIAFFEIGKLEKIKIEFDFIWFVENVQDEAWHEFGELAEGFLDKVSPAEEEVLKEFVNAWLKEQVEKHGNYVLGETETVVVNRRF